MTLALALSQDSTGASAALPPGPRLEEIVIGALIGVAAGSFVYPIRSSAAQLRRMALTLAALAEALDQATPARTSDAFVAGLDAIERMPPALRGDLFLMPRRRSAQPGDWIDALLACRAPAVALISRGATPSCGAARDRRGARGTARAAGTADSAHHATGDLVYLSDSVLEAMPGAAVASTRERLWTQEAKAPIAPLTHQRSQPAPT